MIEYKWSNLLVAVLIEFCIEKLLLTYTLIKMNFIFSHVKRLDEKSGAGVVNPSFIDPANISETTKC